MNRAYALMIGSCLLLGMNASAAQSFKLSDAMLMLSEQVAGLTEFGKLVPGEVTAKVFNRTNSRCRGARLLLGAVNEKKGAVDNGTYVPADLSPEKFSKATAAELPALMKQFEEMVTEVQSLFSKLEDEVTLQAAAAPAARDFRNFKLIMVQLNSAMKKAHGLFM